MTWRERIREEGCPVDDAAISAVDLTTALLRVISKSKAETRRDHGTPELSAAADQLESSLEALLTRDGIPQEFLLRSTLLAFCEALDASSLREGFTAFVAAQVVDGRTGRDFVDAFKGLGGRRLMPGDPFPTIPFPSDRLPEEERMEILKAFGRRTGDPRLRIDPIDRTDHLRLAPPENKDLCVRLRWAEWLEPIRRETCFAFGVPNTAPIRDSFLVPEYTVGTRSCFYGVQPKDPDLQEGRLASILQAAATAAASICVLPELSLTPKILKSLLDRGLLAPLPLVVAGSYHLSPDARGPGQNICEVFAYGDPVASHSKLSDFHYKAEHGGRCHEHLQREEEAPSFELMVGPHCTAVILICKDAMGDAGALVKKLAPTLLLVPAMSEETVDFELLARQLAHDPQAFTLVACAGSGNHVIYGRPSRKDPVLTGSFPEGSVVISAISANEPCQ
jgi:hypothetical protein